MKLIFILFSEVIAVYSQVGFESLVTSRVPNLIHKIGESKSSIEYCLDVIFRIQLRPSIYFRQIFCQSYKMIKTLWLMSYFFFEKNREENLKKIRNRKFYCSVLCVCSKSEGIH